MNSKRKLNNDNDNKNLKKKRNTAEKIADAYSLNIEDFPKVNLPKIKRQIRSSRWQNGHLILDEESKKIGGKKHIIIETHYVWDKNVKFPKQSLLSMWVFAIISIYNKATNSFLRKNVTVEVGKEFSEKYYNHFQFRMINDNTDEKNNSTSNNLNKDNEVFDEKDLINYIIQNPQLW